MSKHRTFTPEFKAQVVLEVLSGVKTAAEACREYELKPSVLSDWKVIVLENAPKLFQSDHQRNPEVERVAECERQIGRLTMELEAAKKASSILSQRLSRKGW
jgi:transposase-like protein